MLSKSYGLAKRLAFITLKMYGVIGNLVSCERGFFAGLLELTPALVTSLEDLQSQTRCAYA